MALRFRTGGSDAVETWEGIPQELRDRVILAADEGIPVGQIAKRFKVSVSYVSKVLNRRAKTGETTARPQVNHVPAKLAAHGTAIRDKLRAERDLTLTELQAWLAKQHAVTVSVRVICKTLKRLNITRKKSSSTPPNRIGPMLPRRVLHGAFVRPR